MLTAITAILLSASTPTQQLTSACIAEGESKAICTCYANFIKKNASPRELKALATLAEPQNRTDLEKAFRALLTAGLSPKEIFDIGLRVEGLTDAATKTCAKTEASLDSKQ
ncbi:hypothetical protein MNBD_ALPHA06-327 [hydrothermal vent metagenome]|uniref:Uncharacterized protein n=1 Tax=hydrothermal vent metagenome TaxID=652676 RepID=A0A3B0S0F1_9ZZZZ